MQLHMAQTALQAAQQQQLFAPRAHMVAPVETALPPPPPVKSTETVAAEVLLFFFKEKTPIELFIHFVLYDQVAAEVADLKRLLHDEQVRCQQAVNDLKQLQLKHASQHVAPPPKKVSVKPYGKGATTTTTAAVGATPLTDLDDPLVVAPTAAENSRNPAAAGAGAPPGPVTPTSAAAAAAVVSVGATPVASTVVDVPVNTPAPLVTPIQLNLHRASAAASTVKETPKPHYAGAIPVEFSDLGATEPNFVMACDLFEVHLQECHDILGIYKYLYIYIYICTCIYSRNIYWFGVDQTC
jgi:hypothetical protein